MVALLKNRAVAEAVRRRSVQKTTGFHVGFAVDRVTLECVFLQALRLPTVSNIPSLPHTLNFSLSDSVYC